MRCLGIPNTAHFANITSIEDARQLWEKLRNNRETERFDPTIQVSFFMFVLWIFKKICNFFVCLVFQEEFEDSLGNVLNKKTHDDLKRQGLL